MANLKDIVRAVAGPVLDVGLGLVKGAIYSVADPMAVGRFNETLEIYGTPREFFRDVDLDDGLVGVSSTLGYVAGWFGLASPLIFGDVGNPWNYMPLVGAMITNATSWVLQERNKNRPLSEKSLRIAHEGFAREWDELKRSGKVV